MKQNRFFCYYKVTAEMFHKYCKTFNKSLNEGVGWEVMGAMRVVGVVGIMGIMGIMRGSQNL